MWGVPTLSSKTFSHLTWEREEVAVNSACNWLQLNNIHGLPDVHCAGHAAQSAPHELCHFLHSEHLQQLIKDSREGVQQSSLKQGKEETENSQLYNCS